MITATARVASIPDALAFLSGRHVAAFPDLAPRQKPTAGKDRLGRISRMGDAYLPTPLLQVL